MDTSDPSGQGGFPHPRRSGMSSGIYDAENSNEKNQKKHANQDFYIDKYSPNRLKKSGSRSDSRHSRNDNDPTYRPMNRSFAPELDVWHLSKSFFKPLPSNEKINLLFSSSKPQTTGFYNFIQNVQNSELKKDNGQGHCDWKNVIFSIHQKTLEKNPNIGLNRITLPKPIVSNSSDINIPFLSPKYNSFQSEMISMEKESIFRRLLCSLVPLDLDTNESSSIKLNSEETQSKKQTQPCLAPVIDTHHYLCFNFLEKLGFELESVGLDVNAANSCAMIKDNDGLNVRNEIDLTSSFKELDSIQQSIERKRIELIDKLPEFRVEQKERMDNIHTFKVLMHEKNDAANPTPRKKRKN